MVVCSSRSSSIADQGKLLSFFFVRRGWGKGFPHQSGGGKQSKEQGRKNNRKRTRKGSPEIKRKSAAQRQPTPGRMSAPNRGHGHRDGTKEGLYVVEVRPKHVLISGTAPGNTAHAVKVV